MYKKTKKYFLLFCFLILSFSATAQNSTSSNSNIKDQLASVNEQVEAVSKENIELKARLSELQNEIDDLKRLSEQKDEELNEARQQNAAFSGDN